MRLLPANIVCSSRVRRPPELVLKVPSFVDVAVLDNLEVAECGLSGDDIERIHLIYLAEELEEICSLPVPLDPS